MTKTWSCAETATAVRLRSQLESVGSRRALGLRPTEEPLGHSVRARGETRTRQKARARRVTMIRGRSLHCRRL